MSVTPCIHDPTADRQTCEICDKLANAQTAESEKATGQRAMKILQINDVLQDVVARYERGGFFDLTKYSIEILKRLELWED